MSYRRVVCPMEVIEHPEHEAVEFVSGDAVLAKVGPDYRQWVADGRPDVLVESWVCDDRPDRERNG